jgi:hypothetical protein
MRPTIKKIYGGFRSELKLGNNTSSLDDWKRDSQRTKIWLTRTQASSFTHAVLCWKLGRQLPCSLFVPRVSTKVEYTLLKADRIVLREQTWGRAVRASHNSREFGALLIWGVFSAVSIQTYCP